jgi:hypothetical protein
VRSTAQNRREQPGNLTTRWRAEFFALPIGGSGSPHRPFALSPFAARLFFSRTDAIVA